MHNTNRDTPYTTILKKIDFQNSSWVEQAIETQKILEARGKQTTEQFIHLAVDLGVEGWKIADLFWKQSSLSELWNRLDQDSPTKLRALGNRLHNLEIQAKQLKTPSKTEARIFSTTRKSTAVKDSE